MNSTHVDKIRIRLLAEKFTKSKNVQGSRVMVAVRKREKLDRRKWFYFRWKVGRCTSRWQSISSPFPRSRQRQNTSSFRLPLFSFLLFFSSDNAITRLIRSARVSSRNLENLGSLSPPALLRCVLCKQFKICFIFFLFIYLFILFFFPLFIFLFTHLSRTLAYIFHSFRFLSSVALYIFFFIFF